MVKSPKKRSRTWIWVIALLVGAVVMAVLGSAMLSGLCFWSAIIVPIVAAVRSSPKPMAGQTTYDNDRESDDDYYSRRHREREQDRRREEKAFQDDIDAYQREREDRGEV